MFPIWLSQKSRGQQSIPWVLTHQWTKSPRLKHNCIWLAKASGNVVGRVPCRIKRSHPKISIMIRWTYLTGNGRATKDTSRLNSCNLNWTHQSKTTLRQRSKTLRCVSWKMHFSSRFTSRLLTIYRGTACCRLSDAAPIILNTQRQALLTRLTTWDLIRRMSLNSFRKPAWNG